MQTQSPSAAPTLSIVGYGLDTSGVSDERRMLTELVEQKLDAYTERKDELVELRTLREGGGSGDTYYDEDPFAPSPVELRKMQEDASKLAASSTSGDEREAEIRDKEQDEDDYTHSKEEASLTDKIADDVSVIDLELRKVESELVGGNRHRRKVQT